MKNPSSRKNPQATKKNIDSKNTLKESFGKTVWPIALTAFITAVVTAIVGVFFANISSIFPPSHDDPHSFSFATKTRTFTGRSSNPFDSTPSYDARIEFCDKYGIEGIYGVASCYLTLKAKRNITISNSANFTKAVYSDGSFAPICCMSFERSDPMPLYIVKLPPGSYTQKTYKKGDEVRINLTIPDVDTGKTLDAISFAPGEGGASVLFPLRNNMNDRTLSKRFIESRRNDPFIQRKVQETIEMRDDLRDAAKRNEGLTYPAE